jgi:hypothetical protein
MMVPFMGFMAVAAAQVAAIRAGREQLEEALRKLVELAVSGLHPIGPRPPDQMTLMERWIRPGCPLSARHSSQSAG